MVSVTGSSMVSTSVEVELVDSSSASLCSCSSIISVMTCSSSSSVSSGVGFVDSVTVSGSIVVFTMLTLVADEEIETALSNSEILVESVDISSAYASGQ